jgi:2-polyprenyl-6-methoxyphenol hydroxylase-like FAD-dependent oxidoreductase
MTDVIVVGSGPVGLWLAGELHLGGVTALILEQAPESRTTSSGTVLHARTLEVLDMRGMAESQLAEGRQVPRSHYALLPVPLPLTGLPSRFPYFLSIPQVRTEALFEERARALGVEIRRGHRVTDVGQDSDGAEVTVVGPEGTYTERAAYVVGCDGGGSAVRKAAGIAFEGTPSTRSYHGGDVELSEPPEGGFFTTHGPQGSLLVSGMGGTRFRIAAADKDRVDVPLEEETTFDELRQSARLIAGTDFGAHSPVWLYRHGNAALLAGAYRSGRIFVAGDAAHIHAPQGGQGLNLGVQDAMNLGWKLSAEVRGSAPEWLLDTYEDERRPVAHRVVRSTQAQDLLSFAVTMPDGAALRDVFVEIMELHPDVTQRLAETVAGFRISYGGSGEDAHDLEGSRCPDLALKGTPSRLFELLRDGRFALVRAPGVPEIVNLEEMPVTVAETADGDGIAWGGADAVLLRPDGYVAWAGAHPQAAPACERWTVSTQAVRVR